MEIRLVRPAQVGAAALFCAVSLGAQPPAAPVPPGDSSLLSILGHLNDYNQHGRPASSRISFEIPEKAVNLYLQWSLRINPRPGLRGLEVRFLAEDRVQAVAQVDLDQVRGSYPGLWQDKSFAAMSGVRTFTAELTLRWKNCLVELDVKPLPSAEPALPAPALRKLVRAIALMQPEHIDTDKPIAPPYGLSLTIKPQLLIGTTESRKNGQGSCRAL
jgi:hypothetical protein